MIPAQLGDTTESLFSRVVIPFPEQNVKVIAIYSIGEVADNCAKVIFDNDVCGVGINDFKESDHWGS